MSDPKQQAEPEISAAEAIRIEAADWILKQRMATNWGEQDRQELAAWQTRSTAHLLAYLRLESAWKQTDRLAALRGPMKPLPTQPRLPWRLMGRISAALAFVAVAGVVGLNLLPGSHQRIFSTGVGGHQRVTLADGSLVELNTNTTVRLAADGSARTAYLDKGEAYFRITHDAAHPFVVLAGSHRIIDVGTAFVVRREPKQLSVALLEGGARFDTPTDKSSQAIELKPGDEVIATAGKVIRRSESLNKLTSELGWRRGNLIFNGTTLAEAAAQFNRYNATKLIIADPDTARLKINGTFAANNARAFIDATQVVLGLKLQNRNSEIVISK
jgi:transmembrane sensor